MEVMPFVAALQTSSLQHAEPRGTFASMLRCGGAESGGYTEENGGISWNAKEVNSQWGFPLSVTQLVYWQLGSTCRTEVVEIFA